MKDKFKILNEIDIDLDKYEDLNINKDKLKQSMRNKIKSKKKIGKRLTIAASIGVVSIGIIGTGTINPSLADSIPVIEDIFKALNYKLNLGYIDDKDIQQIGTSQTSNGTTITIEGAVSDGNNIFLTYKIKSDKKIPREIIPKEDQTKDYDKDKGDLMLYGDVKTRTKGLSILGGSSAVEGYFKDENTFIGVAQYEISDKNLSLPDTVNFEVSIERIGNVMTESNDMITGNWNFNINIDTKSKIKVIDIYKEKDGFTLNNIKISPYSLVADVEFPKNFIANDEEEKNKKENIMKIDINNHKNTFVQSITESGVKHGLEYNYMFKVDEFMKTKPSVVFNKSNIEDEPKTVKITFIQRTDDKKNTTFYIDLEKYK
ncbi:DUF4179 domain-containing protein [Clostridioides difficile]|nr:DUF4179 domain-containing protein [Clostridioides difficile]